MSVLDGLTGIVFVAIIGSLFVITCFISSIKAVRDRFRIKKRIAMRNSNQLDQTKGTIYDNIIVQTPCTSQEHKTPSATFSNGISDRHDMTDSPMYTINAGVDDPNFSASQTNINVYDGHPISEIKISYTGKAPRRTKSHDIYCQRNRNLDHLPADCLSIKKLMRSHSYELAVYENSWMPAGTTKTQHSVPILKVYNLCEDDFKSSEVTFDNKAYDKLDYKIS